MPERRFAGMGLLEVPFGAWSGGQEFYRFSVPEEWRIEMLRMNGWPLDQRAELERVPGLIHAIARADDTVSIAIEDITRPAYLGTILDSTVGALLDVGVRPDRIDLVVALGAHGTMSDSQIRAKVGDSIASRYAVRCHDLDGDLADTGLRMGQVPVRIDRLFCEASLRLSVGCVIPNPYAGFSGAGKMVVPGLASREVLVWMHKLAHMGGSRGPGVLEGSRVRAIIDQVSQALPLHGSVLCLVDEHRGVREVHAGPPHESFPRACMRALETYRTPMDGEYDILICNAYPKDAGFVQAATGYTPLRTGALRHLAPRGTVVLMSSSHEGLGEHGLFGRGGVLQRSPTRTHHGLGEVSAVLFAPGIAEAEARVPHWTGYPFFAKWSGVVDCLRDRHRGCIRVGVFPAAPLQLGPGP